MMVSIGVGLIGCGRAAEHLYLPAFAEVKEAVLSAVCDPNAERLAYIASKVDGCRAYQTPQELLADDGVRAVVIAAPPEHHTSMVQLALEAGRAVLVEKPLTETAAQANHLRICLADHPVPLMVGFNRRCWRPIISLHRALAAKREHNDWTDTTVDMVMTSNVGAWSPISGVKHALDDLGSHQFDLLRFLFEDEIESIACRYDGAMSARTTVRLSRGVRATCHCAQTDVSQERITVISADQRLEVRMGSSRLLPASGVGRALLDGVDKLGRRLVGRKSTLAPSYAMQLRNFIHAVCGGTPCAPGFEDGVAAVRAVEAARQSADNDAQEIILS